MEYSHVESWKWGIVQRAASWFHFIFHFKYQKSLKKNIMKARAKDSVIAKRVIKAKLSISAPQELLKKYRKWPLEEVAAKQY